MARTKRNGKMAQSTAPSKRLPYETVTKTVEATDGTPIRITAPAHLPTPERSEVLRALYKDHVRSLEKDGHWKGPCEAIVAADIADDVAEAMDFHGSIVDDRRAVPGGRVRLYSEGYWAHGF